MFPLYPYISIFLPDSIQHSKATPWISISQVSHRRCCWYGFSPSPLLLAEILQGVMWAGIALATIFTIIKTIIRLHISKKLFIDDALVYIALIVLIIMGVLYTLVNDTIFEIILVSTGKLPATPSFFLRMTFFLRIQFAIIVLFWTALWAVKFSFLVYYKKLFIGLPGNMQKAWWAVSAFALCAYIGCWITQLTSCEPMSSYFNAQCTTPRDVYVSNLSLYYATSVDIICDLMSKLVSQSHVTSYKLLIYEQSWHYRCASYGISKLPRSRNSH